MKILYQQTLRAWEKANVIKLTQIIEKTYFVCSGTILIFKSSSVSGHARDLQEQVALNLHAVFLLFFKNIFFLMIVVTSLKLVNSTVTLLISW